MLLILDENEHTDAFTFSTVPPQVPLLVPAGWTDWNVPVIELPATCQP
jgi:hypothetical protein